MPIAELLAAALSGPAQAAAATLRPAGTVPVPFHGQRGGPSPLTSVQYNTLCWIGDTSVYTRMIEWGLDLPAGVTLDDIRAALSVLVSRHESLRTRYPASRDVQQVAQSGELSIGLYEADAGSDPGALAAALVGLLRGREFDVAAELPLRVAVAVAGGVPLAGVVVYSHVAVDYASVQLLGRQLRQLIADPAARVVGPLTHQPADQAATETSEQARRQTAAALRSWEQQLRRMPQCLFSLPSKTEETAGEPAGPLGGWLWSRAAALSFSHIQARTGASPNAAVLAALAVVVATRTGADPFVITTITHNRYATHMRDYVGTQAGDCLMSVEARAASFDEVARRASLARLRAARGGLVDGSQLARSVTRIMNERGIAYTRDFLFNDLTDPFSDGGEPGEIAGVWGALDETVLHWTDGPPVREHMLVTLMEVTGTLVIGAVTADRRRVPGSDIEGVLRGVERLLVAAAAGDVDLRNAGKVTGVAPIPHGPGWVRAGSCWVELAEVTRLVREATGARHAQAFATGGGGLVAYLTAGPTVHTPEQAHAACVALLPGREDQRGPQVMRFTAMAPARYVICASAPADPADLHGWRSQPVLAEGGGRAGG